MRGIDWGDDFAGYLVQAQTLVSGDFDGLKEDIQRNDFVLSYPWGFPMILAPVIKLFGINMVLIKQFVFLFFIAALFITYRLFRKENKEAVLFAILLAAASPHFWYFKNHLFSDFPNLFFVLLSLLLIRKIVVKQEKMISSRADHCLVGTAIYTSVLMRTQSFVLLLVLAIVQLIYLNRKLLQPKILGTALLPYITFVLLKLLTEALIPVSAIAYSGTVGDFELLPTIGDNLIYYINIWKELFRDVTLLQSIDGIVTGVFLFLALTGLLINAKENLLFVIFAFCHMALLLITPFHQGLRYMIPLVPLLFYFFVTGTFHLAGKLFTRKAQLYTYLFLAPFALFSYHGIADLSLTNQRTPFNMDGPYNASATELFGYLKKRTSEKSIIGFFKPRILLLYSNRNCIVPQSLDECLKRNVKYYVYYRKADTDQIPLDTLTAHPTLLKNVFENADHKVFKVIRGPEDLEESSGGELVMKIGGDYFKGSVMEGPEKLIGIWTNDAVTSSAFNLAKGKYTLSVYSRGTRARGEYPLNQVILNDKSLGTYRSLEQASNANFSFELARDTTVVIKLKLENDLCEHNEDRNTLVSFINIYKE